MMQLYPIDLRVPTRAERRRLSVREALKMIVALAVLAVWLAIVAIALDSALTPAHAGETPDLGPEPAPSQAQAAAGSVALSGALARSSSASQASQFSEITIGGDEISLPGSVDSQASSSSAGQTAEYASSTDVDSWALGLAGVARAQYAAGCHESYGGKSGLGIGTGGRSVINEACLEHSQCLATAAMYAQLGRQDLALAQLATRACGGVPVTEPTITRAECEERQERIEAVAIEECRK